MLKNKKKDNFDPQVPTASAVINQLEMVALGLSMNVKLMREDLNLSLAISDKSFKSDNEVLDLEPQLSLLDDEPELEVAAYQQQDAVSSEQVNEPFQQSGFLIEEVSEIPLLS